MYKLFYLILMIFSIVFSDTIILGNSSIFIYNNNRVGTQIDRVYRDLAWNNSVFEYGKVNIIDSIYDSNMIVPYMEGKISRLLIKYANVTIHGLTPCIALKRNNLFYAMDGNGNYKYLIDPSKTMYKTALISNMFGFFEDTHGFNMVANNAIIMNKRQALNLVIACMDLPSKAEAALELAKNGINCYAPCDRFASILIGYEAKGVIMGSAPIKNTQYGAIIGNQPIEFNSNETIIVQYTNKLYPDQYCDTPTRYFFALKNKFNLNLKLVKINASVGETYKLVEEAKRIGSSIIGVRLYNDKDIEPIRKWLKLNKNNKAVLFHTAAYNIEFFDEFPKQVTFGDLKPLIKK